MDKKKKTYKVLFICSAVVLLVGYLAQNSYYRTIMDEAGVQDSTGEVCQYQYDMIVDNPNSSFWQAVYESGRNTAAEQQILLQLKGVDWETQYDKIDFMNISIAAQVDGIILEYNGEPGLEEKIDEAVSAGIPVVTVMSDAPRSQRQSFVGVSDYQLGTAYGEQVANYVEEDTTHILVLLKRNLDDMNQNQIYSQISSAVLENQKNGKEIKVEGRNLLTTGTFEAEETVRDIFQQESGPPDILVCMDDETTECARQALIDFNMAGKVKIIGYYTSGNILDAVKKGLIEVTCSVDTTQLGAYSVEALTEFKKEGRVSSYYNVDIHFIDKEAAQEMGRGNETNEELSLEKSVSGQ